MTAEPRRVSTGFANTTLAFLESWGVPDNLARTWVRDVQHRKLRQQEYRGHKFTIRFFPDNGLITVRVKDL